MKLTLGTKLVAGFLPVLAILATLGVYTYRELDHLHKLSDERERAADRQLELMALARDVKDLQAIPLHYLGHPSPTFAQQYEEREKGVRADWERLQASAGEGTEQNAWQEAGPVVRSLMESASAVFHQQHGQQHGSNAELIHSLDQDAVAAEKAMQAIQAQAGAAMDTLQRDLESLQMRVKYSLTLAVALTALLGIGSALWTARQITAQLKRMTKTAQRLADGDLTIDGVPIATNDELGDLAGSFNRMVRELRALVGDVSGSAATVASAAMQMGTSAGQVAEDTARADVQVAGVVEGSLRQVDAVKHVGATLQQLRLGIVQISQGAEAQAGNAQQLSLVAGEVNQAVAGVAVRAEQLAGHALHAAAEAAKGAAVVQEAILAMTDIGTTVVGAADRVTQLSHHSTRIGAITETIADIADQTNLLALNAAIEAARAGEHGQGFAVVASEVRRLSERAARSAADIADLVNLVQTDTHQVVDIMARGARTAQGGTALAEQARQALRTIQDTVAQTTAEVSAISLSTRQLTAASQMVADSARASATLAEANSAATEEMAAATEEVTSVLAGVVAISTENRDATAAVGQMTTLVAAAMTEMGVAVENLTQTAADLQKRVGRFRL